jgi:large subunit ribosomal protein L7/L12
VELLDARRQKIEAIVVVRKFTKLGLAEAKKLVHSAPSTVGRSFEYQDALQLVEELRSVGATAEIR